jgi:2-dehydropantoate 2-reductase
MRYTVFGAGSIGGVIVAHLADAGEISVIARGDHLAAISENGLKLLGLDGSLRTLHPAAASDPRSLEPADVVFVALKTYALPPAAEAIVAALKPGGLVIFVQNGMPWWYLRDRLPHPHGGGPSVLDPHGQLNAAFPKGTYAAGVAYFGGAVPKPGTIHHVAGGKFLLGMGNGLSDPRLKAAAELLSAAGLPTEVSSDIGQTIWTKLAANVALNSIAVLTQAPIGDMLSGLHLRPVLEALIAETSHLAAVLGHTVSFDIEAQQSITRPGQKSSTLQDLEAGRPIEYDTLFGAVLDLSHAFNVPMPTLEIMAPLIKERARRGDDR